MGNTGYARRAADDVLITNGFLVKLYLHRNFAVRVGGQTRGRAQGRETEKRGTPGYSKKNKNKKKIYRKADRRGGLEQRSDNRRPQICNPMRLVPDSVLSMGRWAG